MGFFRGPNIVTDGLFLSMDVASGRSYPGTGTAVDNIPNTSYSGTLNNATVSNGVVVTDGSDDYISINYGSGVNPTTQDLSYELWVKQTTTGTDLFLVQGNWSSSNRFYVGLNGGNLAWGLQERGWASSNTSFSPALNEWFHVVITFNGSTALLYGNAEQQASDTSLTSYTFNQNLILGSGRPTDGQYDWFGKIGPIRVYDRTLSAEDIQQNYNALKSRFGL